MDMIVQVIVEVLSILGIATIEIKQNRLSKYSLFKYIAIDGTIGDPEKIGKRLIGKTEMEDALKRLDKLTQEEAWMGIAQNLKATHAVGESVRRVADDVVTIDNRVAGVDNRVASVGDNVASVHNTVKGVDDRVANVDDRVRVVDDRVAEVIRGAYIFFNRSPIHTYSNFLHSDGREVKIAVQQTVIDVDQMKRVSFNLIRLTIHAHVFPQVTNCEAAFTNGSRRRIPQQTITSRVAPVTRNWHLGFLKEASFKIGSQPVHYFGFTGNVRPMLFPT